MKRTAVLFGDSSCDGKADAKILGFRSIEWSENYIGCVLCSDYPRIAHRESELVGSSIQINLDPHPAVAGRLQCILQKYEDRLPCEIGIGSQRVLCGRGRHMNVDASEILTGDSGSQRR